MHDIGTPGYYIDLRDHEYRKADYAEVEELLFRILDGKLKAPAELVVRLYDERKKMREEIRSFEDFYRDREEK